MMGIDILPSHDGGSPKAQLGHAPIFTIENAHERIYTRQLGLSGRDVSVGKPIAVWDVVSSSLQLLSRNPATILIQVIPAVPAILSDILTGASLLTFFGFLFSIISLVLGIMASGAYVPIVKAELTNQPWTIGEGFAKGYRRFWSIVAAGLLVAGIVILGLIALIVPGIIFLCWFAYTIPAIVSEDKGFLEGMAASRAFGRDKKWSTFLLFLTFGLVAFLVSALTGFIPGVGGRVIGSIFMIPVSAWVSVTIVYTYLTHGPSAISPAGSMLPGQPAPQPSAPTMTSTSQFCTNCGTALAPGAKFCPNCGKAV
jgi:uncharacterized membrane protein